MLARFTIFLAVICGTVLCNDEENKNDVRIKDNNFKTSDLYWRSFTSLPVPNDAILAGVRRIDDKNVGIYIGQVHVPEVNGAHYQAVAIFNNSDTVTSTYFDAVSTNENINILCGSKSIGKKIRWIPEADQDQYVPDKNFVVIGHEISRVTNEETNLYMGRGTFEDTMLVGKVVMGSQSLRFYPFYDGSEHFYKNDFEVLAYA